MVTVEAIRNDEQHAKAMKRIQEIFQADLDTPEAEELEILATLVEKYESEYYPIDFPDPIEAIKDRMHDLNLKQKDLIPVIGDKTTVSLIMSKKRPFTLEMVRNLSGRLGLPGEILIKPYDLVR